MDPDTTSDFRVKKKMLSKRGPPRRQIILIVGSPTAFLKAAMCDQPRDNQTEPKADTTSKRSTFIINIHSEICIMDSMSPNMDFCCFFFLL